MTEKMTSHSPPLITGLAFRSIVDQRFAAVSGSISTCFVIDHWFTAIVALHSHLDQRGGTAISLLFCCIIS